MAARFGDRIRVLRIQKGLLIREMASALSIDTALLSKIERGERSLKKEQVPMIAELLQEDKQSLLTLWLADQILNILKGEQLAVDALKMVQKMLT